MNSRLFKTASKGQTDVQNDYLDNDSNERLEQDRLLVGEARYNENRVSGNEKLSNQYNISKNIKERPSVLSIESTGLFFQKQANSTSACSLNKQKEPLRRRTVGLLLEKEAQLSEKRVDKRDCLLTRVVKQLT